MEKEPNPELKPLKDESILKVSNDFITKKLHSNLVTDISCVFFAFNVMNIKSLIVKSHMSCVSIDTKRIARNTYIPSSIVTVLSSVQCLRRTISPPNIARNIARIVIYSIYRMVSARAKTNRFHKVFSKSKVIFPVLVNSDTSTTIMNVLRVIYSFNSIHNMFPSSVLRGVAKTASLIWQNIVTAPTKKPSIVHFTSTFTVPYFITIFNKTNFCYNRIAHEYLQCLWVLIYTSIVPHRTEVVYD